MKFKARLLLLAIVTTVTLAGCAGTSPTKSASASKGAVDDQAVAQIYARLDAAEKRYTDARSGAAGDKAAVEMKAALDDLQAAANQCAATSGCDPQRFIATFDHLLRVQAGSISEAADETPTPEGAGEAGVAPVTAALPEVGRSVSLLKGRELSDIIAMNDPVKVALETWLTQLRPNLMQAYENYEYLRYRMWPEYQRAGLPEAVLFGILAKESGGKVHAVSRSGASGPLQFMYATGARFGLGTVNGFDQRFDPAMSARANASYLNEQLAIFNNNLEMVLGAYNGGEGAMQRIANRNPNSGFWDPKIYFDLPPETRDYVPMVLAAAWLFLHPERYNLTFPKIDGAPKTITLKNAASLDELSVCFGQEGGNPNGWFRTLRNLNPVYEPQQSLPAGTRLDVPARLAAGYDKLCAGGKWQALASDLHSAALPIAPAAPARPSSRPAAPRVYVVKKGETLAGIVRKFGCGSAEQLAGANHLRPPLYSLRVGQPIQLSGCSKY
ncbi:MAG TPA: transglycosylase SLT domain-containing protein [Rudaea sp.]